jgi:hypothetical protein
VRGRPRKLCTREPNGRPSRAAKKTLRIAIEREIKPPGLISGTEVRRFWQTTASNVRTEHFGTPCGQLLLCGKLAETQYEAARRWDRLSARYRQAIGAPRPNPQSPLIEASAQGNGYGDADLRLEVDQAVVERFAAAHSALALCGRAVEKVVRECSEGVGRLPAGYLELLFLRRGLDALARAWRSSGS